MFLQKTMDMCLSKDGTTLASGASDKIVRVRKIGTIHKVHTLLGHQKCIMPIAVTSDNKFIVI